MPPHPVTNFETQKYYQMDLNLMVFIQQIIYLKLKDSAFVISLGQY